MARKDTEGREPAIYEAVTEQQPKLFDVPADWEQHWQDMPEFIQTKQKPFAEIIIRFRNQEDLDVFAKTIGQKLNQRSQCTWFPELAVNGKRVIYVDET